MSADRKNPASDAGLNEAVARAMQKGFGAVLRLEPNGMAPITVDGRGAACVILTDNTSGKTPDADCVWRASKETFLRVLDGGRVLESAYLSSRLHISGDMSVMARLEIAPKQMETMAMESAP